MAIRVQQNSFNAGEFSPYMLGRSDYGDYKNGAQTLENFIVRPQRESNQFIGFFGLGREHDDRNRSGSRVALEVADHLVTGQSG